MRRYDVEEEQKITLVSYGATEGIVTGACNTINRKDSKIVVDYGMFQGASDERTDKGVRRNFDPVEKKIKGTSHILVTHVHNDHTGLIPRAFKVGFTPEVLATRETVAFLEPMWSNSAQIQASKDPQNRLYEQKDVDKALRYVEGVDTYCPISVGQKRSGIKATFIPNGHIIGSASIMIEYPEGAILFSGDMGKPDQSLCGGYNDVDNIPQSKINTLVVESTSANLKPVSFEEKRTKFISAIKDAWAGGGNVLLPTLSLHRSQELMELLHNLQNCGEIPKDCKIFIDAPLAMSVLATFKHLGPGHLTKRFGDDPNFYKTDEDSMNRFNLKNVHIIETHKQSMAADYTLANYPGKAIILASGGMGGHGRAVNYLRENFGKNPNNVIVLNCFQVDGTEGAKLLTKGKVVNKEVAGAKVIKIEGFTSHASGPKEIFGYLQKYNLSELKTVVVTHGKDSARNKMAEEFKSRGYGADIILSRIGQEILL